MHVGLHNFVPIISLDMGCKKKQTSILSIFENTIEQICSGKSVH